MENNKLTQGSIAKSLVIFTVPLILSGMFQQIFNWVDAFIVGNVEGELALAGIGATTTIYHLFVTVIVGFTSGLSVLAAQKFGMGEEKTLKSILGSFNILLTSVFGVIAALGIVFTDQVLMILDTPANIFEVAGEYMRLLLIGVPFLAIYNTYAAVLRGVGNSRAPFLAVIVCSVVNALLDVLLVIVFPFGAAGAAAATAISQIAMAAFIVIYTIRKYPILCFRMNKEIMDQAVIAQGMRFGMPPAIQMGITSVGNIVLQRFMNGFGEQVVAAITTAYRVDTVIILPIVNFGSGIATIVAQNIGAGQPLRAKKVLRTGAVMMALISVCLTAFVIAFGGDLIKMFGLTSEPVEIGKAFFYRLASFYIVYGLAMAVRGYLEGLGDMLFSSVAGVSALVVRIIASYLLVGWFHSMVIAYAEAFSWVMLLGLYVWRYFWIDRGHKSQKA
ncbi:MATE family efflux transporter [Clostridiales bacterium]|nr:MATE family efflux transporter [Clostridiales bacterium]